LDVLFCIVNDPDRLHDVVAALVEAGVPGATVIETQGIGKILSKDIPIFAGFRHLLAGAQPFNYTIMAVVDDPEVVDDAVDLLRDVLDDSVQKGVIFTLPVSRFINLSQPDSD